MDKTFAILLIYDLLLQGEEFNISTLCEKLNVSRRTCLRYMGDLKEYFYTFKDNEKILYDKKKNSFCVINED